MSAAANSAPAHLILIGLPGAGKSTHGRRAARQMQRPFIDLDRRIAKIAGRSVASIFAQDGEAVFRTLEQEATAALASEPASIVAPGGGWVMNPDNVALVKPNSTIIWLQVTPRVAVRRMRDRIRLRPLLRTGNPVSTLEELLQQRQARYALADFSVDTELLDWHGVVDAIAALAPVLPSPVLGQDIPGGVA